MTNKIRPVHSRTTSQGTKAEEKTAGGIVSRETAKDKSAEGKPIAAGPGRREEKRQSIAKVRPLHNRIIVQRIKEEEKTAGGIIIPDTAKEKPTEGKVIAAGPGRRDEKGQLIAMDVKKGDRVLFGKYSGNEVVLDGEDHLIISEDDVLAILE
jgi:chaperonin GroES